MKRIFLLGLLLLPAPAAAASVCTSVVALRNPLPACFTQVGAALNAAGLRHDPSTPGSESYFMNWGLNQVSLRCIGGQPHVVALFAYHEENDQACDLLMRVKNVLPAEDTE